MDRVNSAFIISNSWFFITDSGNFFLFLTIILVLIPSCKSSLRMNPPKYPVAPANNILFIFYSF